MYRIINPCPKLIDLVPYVSKVMIPEHLMELPPVFKHIAGLVVSLNVPRGLMDIRYESDGVIANVTTAVKNVMLVVDDEDYNPPSILKITRFKLHKKEKKHVWEHKTRSVIEF